MMVPDAIVTDGFKDQFHVDYELSLKILQHALVILQKSLKNQRFPTPDFQFPKYRRMRKNVNYKS